MKEKDPYEKTLPIDEAREFRNLYDSKRVHCFCGYDLSKEEIRYYVPHPDCLTINNENSKAWLYVHCPKCNYDMSIWKMGVPRE